jgi:hypothetical protein
MSTHPGSVVKVAPDEATAIIRSDVPLRPMRELILHHFWRPAASDYRGRRTIEGVKRYHVRKRGWRDIAYNWALAPDGDVWTGRTLQWTGGHTIGHNRHSVGLALCLNGDEEPLSDFPDMEKAMLDLSLAICETHGLTETDLFWHADFARKSCPGKLLDRTYYRERLRDRLSGDEGVRLKINDELVRDARLAIEGGTTIVTQQFTWYDSDRRPRLFREGEAVRDVLAGLGYAVYWRGKHGPRGTVYAYGSPI